MSDILQWNCKGLRTRAEELKILIRDNDPGIVCLQETKLGMSSFNPGMNYIFHASPPPAGERAKGGAGIIVKKSIQHSVIRLNTSLQAVAISLILDKQLTVCSLYLPPDLHFTNSDLQGLASQLPTPYLILGDFNSHNPLWGSASIDAKGKIVEDFIDANSLTIYNDGSATFHNVHSNHSSSIDLSICTIDVFFRL